VTQPQPLLHKSKSVTQGRRPDTQGKGTWEGVGGMCPKPLPLSRALWEPKKAPGGGGGGTPDHPPLPCSQILGGPNFGPQNFSAALRADSGEKYLVWFNLPQNSLKTSDRRTKRLFENKIVD